MEEEKNFYKTFEKLSDEQKRQFFLKYDLFYIDKKEIIQTIIKKSPQKKQMNNLFKNIGNHTKEEIDSFIENVELQHKLGQYQIVIDLEEFFDIAFISSNNVYKILDSTNFKNFLILVKDYKKNKSIKLYKERVKKMYDASDLYNLDYTIAKQLIPRMVLELKEKKHGYPNGLTEKEWNDILIQIVWFLQEVISTNETYYELDDDDKMMYAKQLEKSTQLFAKYFNHLWD